MEDYYKILEVNKDASPEIIDRVYKILVKKYHPDLQNETDKATAEEKIKKINEAYEVLSNPDKRKEYDSSLMENYVPFEQYNEMISENNVLRNELYSIKDQLNNYYQNSTQNNYTSQQYPPNVDNGFYNNQNVNYYDTNSYYQFTTYKTKRFTIKKIIKLIFRLAIIGLFIYACFNFPIVINLFKKLINYNPTVTIIIAIVFILFISRR